MVPCYQGYAPGVLRHGLKPKLMNSLRFIRLDLVLALPAWAAGPAGREQWGPAEQRMGDKEQHQAVAGGSEADRRRKGKVVAGRDGSMRRRRKCR